jgi:hypothetical protein
MSTPGDYKPQLAALTAQLCAMVAERLAHWSRDMQYNERVKILEMIEEQLPTVVSNAISKTASLHSASGVEYLEQHLDEWADTWAKKFIGKD